MSAAPPPTSDFNSLFCQGTGLPSGSLGLHRVRLRSQREVRRSRSATQSWCEHPPLESGFREPEIPDTGFAEAPWVTVLGGEDPFPRDQNAGSHYLRAQRGLQLSANSPLIFKSLQGQGLSATEKQKAVPSGVQSPCHPAISTHAVAELLGSVW